MATKDVATRRLAVEGGTPVRGPDDPLTKNSPRILEPKARDLVLEVLDSGFTSDMVARFESAFAEASGVKHALGVSNCTTALHAVMTALGIGPGDDVIVTAISDYGSVAGILYVGANPIFADVDEHTGLITAEEIEKVITPRTRAIVAVHFYGHMCDLDPLIELAAKHKVTLIEDVAQATLGNYKGRTAGSVTDMAVFSFNSSKLLPTDNGGAVTSNDGDFIDRLHQIAVDRGAIYLDEGAGRHHPVPGFNYRFGQLEAAVGIAQLGALPEQNRRRVELGEALSAKLQAIDGVVPPRVDVPGSHLYWLYHMQFEPEKFSVGMDQIEQALVAEGLTGRLAMYYLLPHSVEFIENRDQDLKRLVNAKSHLSRTIRWSWTYRATDRDIDDTVEMVAKVADAYRA